MRSRSQRSQWALLGGLGGLGVGAALMYLFDVESGRRRRAMARDRAAHLLRRGGRGVRVAARDLSHRTQGLAAGIRSRARRGGGLVPDEILRERVRAALGRLTRDAARLEVQVQNGLVTLGGPLFEGDAPRLLRQVRRVRGVESVADHLERFERSEPADGRASDLAAVP